MLALVNEDFIAEVISFVVFIGTGLLFIGLAILMILGKIPFRYYNLRWLRPEAFRNEEIWFQINRYSGRDALVMGIVQVIFNLILLGVNLLSEDEDLIYQLFLPGNLFILIVGGMIIMIRGLLYFRKL